MKGVHSDIEERCIATSLTIYSVQYLLTILVFIGCYQLYLYPSKHQRKTTLLCELPLPQGLPTITVTATSVWSYWSLLYRLNRILGEQQWRSSNWKLKGSVPSHMPRTHGISGEQQWKSSNLQWITQGFGRQACNLWKQWRIAIFMWLSMGVSQWWLGS